MSQICSLLTVIAPNQYLIDSSLHWVQYPSGKNLHQKKMKTYSQLLWGSISLRKVRHASQKTAYFICIKSEKYIVAKIKSYIVNKTNSWSMTNVYKCWLVKSDDNNKNIQPCHIKGCINWLLANKLSNSLIYLLYFASSIFLCLFYFLYSFVSLSVVQILHIFLQLL